MIAEENDRLHEMNEMLVEEIDMVNKQQTEIK
jgi:hypothetical protein